MPLTSSLRPSVQGMPMQMQMMMGPMGPMMGMVPPPGAAAPQQQQQLNHMTSMLVNASSGGRSSNVYFKTRICNK